MEMTDSKDSFENTNGFQSKTKPSKQSADNLKVRKVLWFITILLVVIGFLCHMAVQIEIFLKYEVVQVKQREQFQAEFPNIVICMPSYFGKRRSDENKFNSTISYVSIVSNIIAKTWDIILNKTANNDINKASTEALNAAKLTFLPQLAQLQVASTAGDVLTACQYNNLLCDYKNFTAFMNYRYGICLSFQSNPVRLQQYQNGIKNGLNLNLLMENQLVLLDKTEVFYDYVPGYAVFIQPAKTWPNLQTPNFIATSERQLIVGFTQSRIIHLNRPKYECAPVMEKRLCRLEYKVGLKCQSYKITEEADKFIKYQEYLAMTCRCVTYEWPVPEALKNYQSCHYLSQTVYLNKAFNATSRILSTTNETRVPLSSLLNLANMRTRFACYKRVKENLVSSNPQSSVKWVKLCEDSQYKTDVADYLNPFASGGALFTQGISKETGPFVTETNRLIKAVNDSNGHMTSILQSEWKTRSLLKLKQTGTHLSIYATTTQLDAKMENLEYDRGRLFADLGGLSGVWIGLSALSLLAFTDYLFGFIYKCRNKKTSTK